MIEIKKINSNENDFLKILENHTRKRIKNTSGVKERVKNIISEVRNYGDDALLRFSKEFEIVIFKTFSLSHGDLSIRLACASQYFL